jgi:DNA-binding response OmpR family regulator
MRLLLVEDEMDFATPLCKLLRESDYAVDHAPNAEDAEEFLFTTTYDALLLDVNLPKKSGLELLNQLRAKGNMVPVLMLTARDTTQQKIEGLNTGADDYLVKPFEFNELLARLQALIRRSNRRASPTIQRGDLVLDTVARSLHKQGEQVHLSAREFVILSILMENIGRVLNKQQIEEKLYSWDTEHDSNAVEVHISNLRKKLGSDLIKTIRGLGYIVEKIS